MSLGLSCRVLLLFVRELKTRPRRRPVVTSPKRNKHVNEWIEIVCATTYAFFTRSRRTTCTRFIVNVYIIGSVVRCHNIASAWTVIIDYRRQNVFTISNRTSPISSCVDRRITHTHTTSIWKPIRACVAVVKYSTIGSRTANAVRSRFFYNTRGVRVSALKHVESSKQSRPTGYFRNYLSIKSHRGRIKRGPAVRVYVVSINVFQCLFVVF